MHWSMLHQLARSERLLMKKQYTLDLKEYGQVVKLVKFLIEYLTFWEGKPGTIVPQPLRNKDLRLAGAEPWDVSLIERILQTSCCKRNLYDLACLSYGLEVHGLCYLCCACIASWIKSCPAEMKNRFGICAACQRTVPAAFWGF